MKPKLLFDLDGTLVDSAPGILQTLQTVLTQCGKNVPQESLRPYLGPPLRETMAQLLPDGNIEQAVCAYRALYAQQGLFQANVYEGVPAMLQRLQKAGYSLCIATSKPQQVATQVLQHFSLEQYFCVIGGASMDASLDTKTAVMQDVLKRANANTAIMIGDRLHDMIGAQECGVPAIGALYGYGSREELTPFEPIYLAQTPADLCEYLLCGKF